MNSEIFRFVTVRPPQAVAGPESTATIDLAKYSVPFIDALREVRPGDSRAHMVALAQQFVRSDAFIGSTAKIDQPYGTFMAVLRSLPEQDFWSAAGQAFADAFFMEPADLVEEAEFQALYARASESLVAAMIDSAVGPRVRTLLVDLLRAIWLIRRLAKGKTLTRVSYASAAIVVPPGIFPLPAAASDEEQSIVTGATAAESGQRRVAQLTAELAACRAAKEEIIERFTGTDPQPTTVTGDGTSPAVGFALTDVVAQRLTDDTKRVLRELGQAGDTIDVVRTVSQLEQHAAEIARRLYSERGAVTQMVRVGDVVVPQTDSDAGPAGVMTQSMGTPGPCPPAAGTTIPSDGVVTVPTGHGEAKVLGIADLMLVEQKLLRYELGEIAHVENVLRSETRSRTFKTSSTTEVEESTETETTEEKSQDLSSAERFELQTESQTVINNNANTSVGLTIHASYGPTVDATSNFNYSSGNSRQQSTGAATNFAREVTTKAAHRVQTRTLTRRSVRTVNVIEETNEHGFDNKSGANDIVGIYRYVDKVYRAQVVNYGKRLLLEFIVPEPAAFLRHALTRGPVDGVSVVEPEAPGYCVPDIGFLPLRAEDITRENYLFWASKYGAQDVVPPPASVILAAGAKKSPEAMTTTGGDRLISSELLDVTIADGYLCQSAAINIYGETQAGDHKVVYQIQDKQGVYVEPTDDANPVTLHLRPTPSLAVSINSLGFYNYEVLVTVFCTLSVEKFQAWQLKTFHSIMSAYLDEKSRYDQAVAEATLRARDATVGVINPRYARETEQIELKKGCVSLLTGQRFDLFDAVGRNVAPYGYPEINFAEAQAEGRYIQAFEHSLEWNNMTYVFYPYFWGNKSEWPTVSQLANADADAQFARFLQAGAARVQVPVRLGFEASMMTYLATGELWSGDGTVVNADGDSPDEQHLSILEELKRQSGDDTVAGPGTLTVTQGSIEVTGSGTAFTADDGNRRIRCGGQTYVIATVLDEQTISLSTPYAGVSASGVTYSLGGKLVGEPWEVTLPTNLVKLDNTLVVGWQGETVTPTEQPISVPTS